MKLRAEVNEADNGYVFGSMWRPAGAIPLRQFANELFSSRIAPPQGRIACGLVVFGENLGIVVERRKGRRTDGKEVAKGRQSVILLQDFYIVTFTPTLEGCKQTTDTTARYYDFDTRTRVTVDAVNDFA